MKVPIAYKDHFDEKSNNDSILYKKEYFPDITSTLLI